MWYFCDLCKICFLQFVFKFISNTLSRLNYFYKTHTTNIKKNVRTVLWSIVRHLQHYLALADETHVIQNEKKKKKRGAFWRSSLEKFQPEKRLSLFFLFVEIDAKWRKQVTGKIYDLWILTIKLMQDQEINDCGNWQVFLIMRDFIRWILMNSTNISDDI